MSDLLIWEKKYEMGIQSIDQQHKKLFAVINTLHTAILNDTVKEHLKESVKEIVSYTEFHFSYEEELLKRTNYPFFEDHLKEHHSFKDLSQSLLNSINQGTLIMGSTPLAHLKAWWDSHILITDKKYAAYLVLNGVK